MRKPWFAVPGNHETTWSESACTTFGRLFGNDGRLAFRAGGYLFVGFTAGPYMKMADGSVRREDLQWVEEQMRAARPGERIVTSGVHRLREGEKVAPLPGVTKTNVGGLL